MSFLGRKELFSLFENTFQGDISYAEGTIVSVVPVLQTLLKMKPVWNVSKRGNIFSFEDLVRIIPENDRALKEFCALLKLPSSDFVRYPLDLTSILLLRETTDDDQLKVLYEKIMAEVKALTHFPPVSEAILKFASVLKSANSFILREDKDIKPILKLISDEPYYDFSDFYVFVYSLKDIGHLELILSILEVHENLRSDVFEPFSGYLAGSVEVSGYFVYSIRAKRVLKFTESILFLNEGFKHEVASRYPLAFLKLTGNVFEPARGSFDKDFLEALVDLADNWTV